MFIAKLPSSPFIWFFFLIVSPVAILTQIVRKEQPQSLLSDNDPLLRFNFAKFLANPCGLMSTSSLHNDLIKSIGIGKFGNNKMMPNLIQPSPSIVKIAKASLTLSQEALQFIEPFRQQYNINRNLFTNEERAGFIEEFLLVIQEVKHRSNILYSPKDLHQCENIQLTSFSSVKPLINEKGEFQVKEIYRALAITAAHLHLITRNHLINRSHAAERCDGRMTTEAFYLQNIRTLTGKVETLMCLILPLWRTVDSEETSGSDQLFNVIHQVLQMNIPHKYSDCSAREIQLCLIMRFGQNVFNVGQQFGNYQRRQLSTQQ